MSVIRPRRTKIGKDPNNTAWARDESTFGQRFMRSQGWQPGDVLGDPNSGHAGMHSAASTSHIRVSLKDDSNGLGWKPGGPDGDDALTGMDVLKDIFGRLNGKGGEEGRREQQRKKGLMYLGRRGGGIAFVRGGLLVGDEMKEDKKDEDTPKPQDAPQDSSAPQLKRKRDEEDTSSDDADADSDAERQARKRRKAAKKAEKAEKKEKKAAKKALKAARKAAKAAVKEAQALASAGTTPADSSSSSSSSSPAPTPDSQDMTPEEAKAAKKRAKKEKKEKKAAKKAKKAAKHAQRQSRVVVRSRLSTHKKAPLDSDAMKRLFMVG